MDDLANVNKPTKEEIELWIANKLDQEEMKRVTAGLLLYKDADIQDHLQKSLLQEEHNIEEQLFSNLIWVKKILSDIFVNVSRSLIDNLSVSLAGEKPRPLYLGETKEEIIDETEKTYTISVQSKSDLRVLIKIPEGKYLVTTIFVNSEEEMGFIYPDLDELPVEDLEKFVVEGGQTIPIVKKGCYTIQEDEVDLVVTRCPALKKHLNSFILCVQEIEELGVIRWLKYIKQNDTGDFSIANVKFTLKK